MKATRCPTCNTVFRVSAEQLEARQGRVRCGQCAHIFNALDCLVAGPDGTAPTESAPELRLKDAVAEMPAVLDARRRLSPMEVPEFEPAEPESEPEPQSDLPESDLSEAFAEDAVVHPISPEAMRDERPPHAPVAAPLEDREASPIPSAGGRNLAWLWGLGIGLLLMGAIGQGAFVFRTELAMSYPNLRPQFIEWCRSLGCDMPLPKKSDLIGIEASELRPSPQGKNLLQLVATLRNRAGFPQAWPHLELTLTDTDDKPLARRVFSPREFLPAKADGATGFPAGGDMALSLTLDPTSLTAAGYRIYVFYP